MRHFSWLSLHQNDLHFFSTYRFYLEIATSKYPQVITILYPYPRQKNNLVGSPIFTGGYGFTSIFILMWVWVTRRVLRTHKN
jgi:hypothetical protein